MQIQSDDPDLPWKTLGMFKQGYDTYAMSVLFGLNECVVERSLHVGMASAKLKAHTQTDGESRG